MRDEERQLCRMLLPGWDGLAIPDGWSPRELVLLAIVHARYLAHDPDKATRAFARRVLEQWAR